MKSGRTIHGERHLPLASNERDRVHIEHEGRPCGLDLREKACEFCAAVRLSDAEMRFESPRQTSSIIAIGHRSQQRGMERENGFARLRIEPDGGATPTVIEVRKCRSVSVNGETSAQAAGEGRGDVPNSSRWRSG